ncbi:two pore domain potassium channel family protein [Candidatus Saganbacteria bacterium]|nr:two pore domain potassium channel family protein [Candidatus Saganbacteria bacterium]
MKVTGWRTITHKIKCFPSLFSWAFWGYGEKPQFIIAWMSFTIITFSLIYCFIGQNELSNYYTSLYFSIVTFTTLGYGDIVPFGHLRLVAASEALIGAVLIALLVAGYVNKEKQ